MSEASRPSAPKIETIGEARSKIPVEIGVRFLRQFSEQLYSSPQKAFEELISSGWDAGASRWRAGFGLAWPGWGMSSPAQ